MKSLSEKNKGILRNSSFYKNLIILLVTMATIDKKRYNKMENVLQYINKNFVTVSAEDAKKTNPLLKYLIDKIIAAMKTVSPLFDSLFESVLFGGSYFDGLKVGKPEEFDIDLRLVLPKLVEAKLMQANVPGFVSIKMPGWERFEKSNEFQKKKKRYRTCKRDRFILFVPEQNKNKLEKQNYSRREYKFIRDLAKFKDSDNYLVQDKVLQWMESTVNQALNKIGMVNKRAEIEYEGKIAYVTLQKSGPAVTAKVTYGGIKMDVDLVVVFKLTSDQWPASPFRPLPKECSLKKEFLIVPKAPKVDINKKERYWRLSFQEQERIIIGRNNTCKPALRLIKKLRDNKNHNLISSYFIKTVFLHEIEKQDSDPIFWNASLSFIFMHMLKTYRDCLANYNIPYYWNKNNNLVQLIDKITIDNFCNYLTRAIDAIDSKINDNPFIVADYLSTPEEREQLLKVNISFGKKSVNVDQISIVENSLAGTTPSLQVVMTNLYQTNTDEVNSDDKTDNNSNNKIISLLKNIQLDINSLQIDVKYVVQKVNVMENALEEVQNDNKNLSYQVKNVSLLLSTVDSINCQKKHNDLIEQTRNIQLTLQKIDSLDKTVQSLKSEHCLLKTSLKQFVLSD